MKVATHKMQLSPDEEKTETRQSQSHPRLACYRMYTISALSGSEQISEAILNTSGHVGFPNTLCITIIIFYNTLTYIINESKITIVASSLYFNAECRVHI